MTEKLRVLVAEGSSWQAASVLRRLFPEDEGAARFSPPRKKAIMPKLGGVATAQKLLTNFRGLPVIFTNGYSQDSENVGAAATNAHYLQKPYSPMALGCQVREILDQLKRGKPPK